MQIDISDEAFAVVCGLVQDAELVQSAAIYMPATVWTELREKFPLEDFREAVAAGAVSYMPKED